MSWDKIKLGEVCTIEKGTTGILKAISGEFPLVVTGKERKSHNEFQFNDEAVIVPLVSGTGHGHASIKRIHFQRGKFALGSILCAIIPKDKNQLSAAYLYRFLDLNKENELVARMKGMANVTLPLKEIAQIEIPVPSLIEQKKFVETYEVLENKSELLFAELTHQLNLVKKLRQQLLQDAVQGKLVGQNKKDEPASELLKKIKAEKEKLIAEKKLKKEKELPPIKPEEIPFDIPGNWVWCRLGEIAIHITDGEHVTPQKRQDGRMLLSAKNIRDGFITYDNIDFISEEDFQKSIKRCKPEKNDILIVSVGGTIGRSTIMNDDVEFAIVRSVALIKPFYKSMDRYIKFILDSPILQKEINGRSWGTAQPCLYINQIKELTIPLPPLSEQIRIVQKLDELMKYCNELEASIKQSKTQNEKLLQQVLREALTKELV